jgi:hypothetical protein
MTPKEKRETLAKFQHGKQISGEETAELMAMYQAVVDATRPFGEVYWLVTADANLNLHRLRRLRDARRELEGNHVVAR